GQRETPSEVDETNAMAMAETCWTLLQVLTSRPSKTRAALASVDALSTLTPLLVESGRYALQRHGTPLSMATHYRVRICWTCMSIFDHLLLSNDEMTSVAYKDDATLDMMFAFIRESHQDPTSTTALFTITHLNNMLRAIPAEIVQDTTPSASATLQDQSTFR